MRSSVRFLFLASSSILFACASTSDPSSSWSRSYLAQRDAVIDAVVEVLEDEHYLVEVDRESGRVAAEPSRAATGGRSNLVVRIQPRKGRMAVDVQTRSGPESSQRAGKPAEAQVLEFLHELDMKLQGKRE